MKKIIIICVVVLIISLIQIVFIFNSLAAQVSPTTMTSPVPTASATAQPIGEQPSADMAAAIDFLRAENERMGNEFDRRWSFVYWGIGIIGGVLLLIIAFFGVSTKRDITSSKQDVKRMMQEKFDNEIKKQFDDRFQVLFDDRLSQAIGKNINDEDKLKFLSESVERISSMHQKKIVFAVRDMTKSGLDPVEQWFGEEGCKTEKKEASTVSQSQIRNIVGPGGILLIEVIDDEGIMNQSLELAIACEIKKIDCILFCPGFRIPDHLMKDRNTRYVSTVQYISTLRQMLYNLMYFAPVA